MIEMKRYLLFNSLVSWGVLALFVLFALAGQQSSPPPSSGVRPDVGPAGQAGYDLGYTLGPIILGLAAAALVDVVIGRIRK